MKFLAVLAGGIGPGVWDKEVEIDAAGFDDAARMAYGRAEEAGGIVLLLELWDGPHNPVAASLVYTLRRWSQGDTKDLPSTLRRMAFMDMANLADWIEAQHILK
jgi:hypothetical protein